VYAGTDPLTMHAIRLKSTVKTEQQAYQARQAAQGSVRRSESLPMAFPLSRKGLPAAPPRLLGLLVRRADGA